VNCRKNNFKIYIKIDIKTAPTCFSAITSVMERIIRACSNSALPEDDDDDDDGDDDDDDSTETSRSPFNVNFKIVFKTIHL
jgi:hypothetical protein